MTWLRAAIASCATVATLAGAVSLVAGAVDADRPRPAGTTADGPTASAYRSSVTITLDRTTQPCTSLPDTDPRRPPGPAPCAGAVRLPVGATEQDVIRALGPPQSRRTLGPGTEDWGYSWELGQALPELVQATLHFDGHRLVDAQEYVFK